MSKTFPRLAKDFLTQNLSYKLVSLFIAMVLWMTILGRRDFIVNKEFELEIVSAPHIQVQALSANKVNVKVTGSKNSLRQFVDRGASTVVVVDLSSKEDGNYDIEIPIQKFDLPFGVKVLQVRPNQIHVKLVRR